MMRRKSKENLDVNDKQEDQNVGATSDAVFSHEQFLDVLAAASGGKVIKGGGGSSAGDTPFEIGKSYFVRTITYFTVGKVVDIVGKFLVMEQASWVADTGRWGDCLAKGASVIREVEPHPKDERVYINLEAVVDVSDWNHDLPTAPKS